MRKSREIVAAVLFLSSDIYIYIPSKFVVFDFPDFLMIHLLICQGYQ